MIRGDKQIAFGDDPGEYSSGIDHRQVADPMLLHQSQRTLEVGIVGDGDRRDAHVLANVHPGSSQHGHCCTVYVLAFITTHYYGSASDGFDFGQVNREQSARLRTLRLLKQGTTR
jgi:hypothetical protein